MDIQYKIIGGDGCEYGPVTLEELESWIRDGRAAGHTSVLRSDSQAWVRASTLVELSDALRTLVPLRPPRMTSATDEMAVGFVPRLAAYLLDMFVWMAIAMVVWDLVLKMTGWPNPQLPQPDPGISPDAYLQTISGYVEKMMPVILWQTLVVNSIRAFYEISFNTKFGATPGKLIVGAKIVRLDGSPIGLRIAVLRWLGAWVSDLILCMGYLPIIFRNDKRALHDLIAGTKVIYKRQWP